MPPPEVGASAQEVINVQVLEKCDFLVGVFWTRTSNKIIADFRFYKVR